VPEGRKGRKGKNEKKEGTIHFRDVNAALDTLMILVLRIYLLNFYLEQTFFNIRFKNSPNGCNPSMIFFPLVDCIFRRVSETNMNCM
jgi:hypothetical protein